MFNEEFSTVELQQGRREQDYKIINTNVEALKEINTVMTNGEVMNSDCISLYDVCLLLKEYNDYLEGIRKKYTRILNSIVKSKVNRKATVVINDFNYDKNEIQIGVKRNRDSLFLDTLTVTKKYGNLIVSGVKEDYLRDIYRDIHASLEDVYDEMMLLPNLRNSNSGNLRLVNSNFFVVMAGDYVYIKKNNSIYIDFGLGYNFKENNYELYGNYDVMSSIEGKEAEIFKNIFINIADCPEVLREELSEIRNKQLNYGKKDSMKRKVLLWLSR